MTIFMNWTVWRIFISSSKCMKLKKWNIHLWSLTIQEAIIHARYIFTWKMNLSTTRDCSNLISHYKRIESRGLKDKSVMKEWRKRQHLSITTLNCCVLNEMCRVAARCLSSHSLLTVDYPLLSTASTVVDAVTAICTTASHNNPSLTGRREKWIRAAGV